VSERLPWAVSRAENRIDGVGGRRGSRGEPRAGVRIRGVVANFGTVSCGLEPVCWGGRAAFLALFSGTSSSNTLLPLQDPRWKDVGGSVRVALSILPLEDCFPLPFKVLGLPVKVPNAAERGGSGSGAILLELQLGALLVPLVGAYCVAMCSGGLPQVYVHERRELGFVEGMFALARAATFGYCLSIRVAATGGGGDRPRRFS